MTDFDLCAGDCQEVLKLIDENSIDTCITDPPYGLSFMNKTWDGAVPSAAVWQEVLRVLKPGAILLAFGGTRTSHRLACAIEDAGFQIRDQIMWLYGRGFPKSLNISKALDKQAGAERQVIGTKRGSGRESGDLHCGAHSTGIKQISIDVPITAPATDAAKLWDGWGTALKPGWEPIIVAMKPIDGTYANNALVHGVAGLNIDGSRIHADQQPPRWPTNLILDEDAAKALDAQTGPNSSGGASRFFYCFKASKKDRGEGNDHPTVKPRKLMEYLARLTGTPTGGTVLDPFMGSGSTGIGALLAGRDFIGIDLEPKYVEIARNRLTALREETDESP